MISLLRPLRHLFLLAALSSLWMACWTVLAVGSAAATADQPALRQYATRRLQNGRMVAEVMDPNHPQRYNRGTRFSPVANVLAAELDGRSFLFSPTDHDALLENGGLAMEFDLDTPGGPPGFAEAAIGERYVKIGVGVLQKKAERYRFFEPQEVIEFAHTEVTWAADRAEFQQICAGVNGYAYALNATVIVEAERIAVSFRLTNTGQKPFTTEQYAHNYFFFSNVPIGPGYEVEFPATYQVAGMTNGQIQTGRTLRFVEPLIKPVNLTITSEASLSTRVEVRSKMTGQRLVASTSLPVARTKIHATSDYLCPEQFIRIALAPGESESWVREYRFTIGARDEIHPR